MNSTLLILMCHSDCQWLYSTRLFTFFFLKQLSFVPRDATQSSVSLRQVVCPSASVRLSLTSRYHDHIGWNISTVIPMLVMDVRSLQTPTSRIYSKENTLKFWPKVTPPLLKWASQTFWWQIATEWSEIAQSS